MNEERCKYVKTGRLNECTERRRRIIRKKEKQIGKALTNVLRKRRKSLNIEGGRSVGHKTWREVTVEDNDVNRKEIRGEENEVEEMRTTAKGEEVLKGKGERIRDEKRAKEK